MNRAFPRRKPGIWTTGDAWVWLSTAGAVITVLMLVGLVGLVSYNGLSALWPHQLAQFELVDGSKALGELKRTDEDMHRIQIKSGNRDLYGIDFRWIDDVNVSNRSFPENAWALERLEHGHFYGFLTNMNASSASIDGDLETAFAKALKTMALKREELNDLESELASINTSLESLNLELLDTVDKDKRTRLEALKTEREEAFEVLRVKVDGFRSELQSQYVTMADCNGRTKDIPLFSILRAYQPNSMSVFSRTGLYLSRMLDLLTEPPREANTEGGLFPAIFGTAMMVLLMSLFTMPLGVVAAVYLREYAKEGLLVRIIRITVNNLAGVPSIVYGIFGLGFFVYGIGGTIDDWFFSNRLPTPTFGTGGLLWASLTMALLTMPVVIVATEEGLCGSQRHQRRITCFGRD